MTQARTIIAPDEILPEFDFSALSEADSLDDQLRLCRGLAERHGWQIVGVYEDDNISGARKGRVGYLSLLADAIAGKFDLVTAESLDRLNRDLEETARLYKQLAFVSVGMHTVSEGAISEVHVSISGLMGELFLKALGEKTRRGLEGRVLVGKSGGGNSYGYDIVGGVDPGGNRVTGEREINEFKAGVVREIFRRFANGEGPRAIARALNDRGVPGPSGRSWGDTTIRGHAKKGSGILNNELYRGRLVWGRQRFVKNPATGRRVARLNAAGAETVIEVPHLRIIDDELWWAVKTRQHEVSRPVTNPNVTMPLNDTHRPRFLLSGLLTCGVCGGGYTIRAKNRYGCARRGSQGTCSNGRTILRQDLERRILDGLRSSLVTPEMIGEFTREYIAEWNRLQANRRTTSNDRDRKLADVRRRLASIMDAIEQGIITPTTKERLETLEAEKTSLEQAPAEEPMPAIHPNLARRFRYAVAGLEDALADPELATEAKVTIRALVKTIVIHPGDRRGEVGLELHGELATILGFAQTAKANSAVGRRIQVSVVAGGRHTRSLRNPKNAKSDPLGSPLAVSQESVVAGKRNTRPLRNEGGDKESQVSVVAGAGNTRYLQLLERRVPKLAAEHNLLSF
jgi:DNA invertase Pin-like site-specific DNA recombinase